MLNKSQVKYLASLLEDDFEKIFSGYRFKAHENNKIVVKYDEFKNNMELDDIRFHWLLGNNSYIAGGAVLAWIMSESFNNDTDFFFTNINSAKAFENLVEGYGFVESGNTNETRTYTYNEDSSIIQLVGINDPPRVGGYGHRMGGNLFMDPVDTLSKFDFTVSQFAVDCEYLYTFKQSMIDTITKSLYLVSDYTKKDRLNKYLAKGFNKMKTETYTRRPIAEYKTRNRNWY